MADLEDLVATALDNAVENGADPYGMDEEELAEDLTSLYEPLEIYEPHELLPGIRAWKTTVAQAISNGGASRKRRARKAKPAVEVASTPPPPPVVQTAGTSKSITLKRGETLTLSVTADFFAMDPGDLDFLFGIVKQLEDYERKVGASILSGQSQTDTGGEE